MTALNPVHTIARQVGEPLRLHRGLSKADARKEVLALLDRVGIPDAASRLDAYPHQFSGGQRQRIGIAMALACGPDLLIADEPTTALDVTIQKQILELIQGLVAERGMALILISHDLGVIAQTVSKMLVMYGGSVVESGPTAAVFARARPSLHAGPVRRASRASAHRAACGWPPSSGSVPELVDLPQGCPFAGRCSYTVEACQTTRPPATMLPHGSRGALHPARRDRHGRGHRTMSTATTPPLLQVTDLVRHYALPREKPLRPAAHREGAQRRELRACRPARAWASSANRARASRPSRAW